MAAARAAAKPTFAVVTDMTTTPVHHNNFRIKLLHMEVSYAKMSDADLITEGRLYAEPTVELACRDDRSS
jgi:hypothetical protein